MCEGEATGFSLHLELTVSKTFTLESATANTTSQPAFERSFRTAMAENLDISPSDIKVDKMMPAASTGHLRRRVQDQTQVVVSFTVAAGLDKHPLITKINELRNSGDTTVTLVDNSGTALVSTLTEPAVSIYVLPGIQCRTGHDPSSPLCHVCTEGFVEGMDMMCFECDAEDASISSETSTLLMCVGIILAILLVFAAHHLYRGYAERGERKDAGEMHWVKPTFTAGGSAPLSIYAKICISHYQILTQFRK
jgi:hypothetical protein